MIAQRVDPAAARGLNATTPGSIEDLARAQAGQLLRLATGILGDPSEAEDAVQDTLLLAWKSWDQVREPERRSAWLTRICVRRCLRVRLALLRRRADRPDTDMAHMAATPDERWTEWDVAFGRLSRQQRAVVILHYRHEFTLDESATLMGCRPGSARRHLSRALARLRREIEE